jgi:hypothetical protein
LEERLTAVEQEVARLRQAFQHLIAQTATKVPPTSTDAADRGRRLLAQAHTHPAEIQAVRARVFAEMEVRGQPIGAEQLQARMLAAGADPNNDFGSREIERMREE